MEALSFTIYKLTYGKPTAVSWSEAIGRKTFDNLMSFAKRQRDELYATEYADCGTKLYISILYKDEEDTRKEFKRVTPAPSNHITGED